MNVELIYIFVIEVMGFVLICMEVLNVFVRNLGLKVMDLFVKVRI